MQESPKLSDSEPAAAPVFVPLSEIVTQSYHRAVALDRDPPSYWTVWTVCGPFKRKIRGKVHVAEPDLPTIWLRLGLG